MLLEESRKVNKIQATALEALQEASEARLTRMFEQSQMFAAHAKRVTVMPKDMRLLKALDL